MGSNPSSICCCLCVEFSCSPSVRRLLHYSPHLGNANKLVHTHLHKHAHTPTHRLHFYDEGSHNIYSWSRVNSTATDRPVKLLYIQLMENLSRLQVKTRSGLHFTHVQYEHYGY